MKQQQNCPVGRTLALISGKWKPLLLFLISKEVNRFALLQKKVNGVSAKVLTSQLRGLEQYGLIARRVIKQKHPQVVVYDVTSRGATLLALLDQLFEWGAENLMDETMGRKAKEEKERYDAAKAA